MHIGIRNAEANDIERVRDIVRAAWKCGAESPLVDVVRAHGKAIISLVAVNGDDVLGHILFGPVTTAPPGEADGLGLAPVVVRPDTQSQGIGSQLSRERLRLCKELDFDYCVVLGGPRYYQRFGFEKASPFGIRNEYGVHDEFMVIRFSAREGAGVVQYVTEFSLFSVRVRLVDQKL